MSTKVRPGAARAVGRAEVRLEGRDKVTGRAPYAVEHPIPGMVYGWPVQSAFVGRIVDVDARAALALDGVLEVLWHANAPRLRPSDMRELLVLQSPRVAYHGQVVALVVGTSLEAARQGAELVTVVAERKAPSTRTRAKCFRAYSRPAAAIARKNGQPWSFHSTAVVYAPSP